MQNQNLNILVAARDEYDEKMANVMLPHVVALFVEMYERAKTDSKGNKTLILFQEYLRDIKNWNQGVLKEHTTSVTDSCAYFRQLLTAVFVGHVKVLTSVRLKDETQNISIKLPKTDEFVYRVFEENAKVIYKNPYFMQDIDNEDDLFSHIQAINSKIIKDVTKSMVPIQQILETYMNPGTVDEHEIGMGATDAADPVADDAADPTDPMGESEEPPMDPTGEPDEPPMDPTDPLGEPDGEGQMPGGSGDEEAEEAEEAEDVKSVPLTGRGIPHTSPEDDDDTLFGDAPESRSKNYGA